MYLSTKKNFPGNKCTKVEKGQKVKLYIYLHVVSDVQHLSDDQLCVVYFLSNCQIDTLI